MAMAGRVYRLAGTSSHSGHMHLLAGGSCRADCPAQGRLEQPARRVVVVVTEAKTMRVGGYIAP